MLLVVLILALHKLSAQQKNSMYHGDITVISKEIKQSPLGTNISASNELIVTGNADVDFKKLSDLRREIIKYNNEAPDGSVRLRKQVLLVWEKLHQRYRVFGLQLWKYYPADERRYNWFWNTALSDGNILLHYWQNIDEGNRAFFGRSSNADSYTAAIDWTAMDAWEKAYPEMKQTYFNHFSGVNVIKNRQYSPINKTYLEVVELESFLKKSLNSTYRRRNGNDKIDVSKLEKLIIQAADIMSMDDSSRIDGVLASTLKDNAKRALDNSFLARCYNAYGLTDNDLRDLFYKFIRNTDNKGLKEWGIQRRTLLNLRENPLDLAAVSIDGRLVDLRKMRGKVVLVDFWSTWCSSCIERMPAIKKMYEKYKSDGFEVVSVCFNEPDKLEEVKKIGEKIGGKWPTLLVGGTLHKGLGQDIFQKYGFFGVPQLLLLDKEGKLVMLNDVLRDGDFESILTNLLKESN